MIVEKFHTGSVEAYELLEKMGLADRKVVSLKIHIVPGNPVKVSVVEKKGLVLDRWAYEVHNSHGEWTPPLLQALGFAEGERVSEIEIVFPTSGFVIAKIAKIPDMRLSLVQWSVLAFENRIGGQLSDPETYF